MCKWFFLCHKKNIFKLTSIKLVCAKSNSWNAFFCIKRKRNTWVGRSWLWLHYKRKRNFIKLIMNVFVSQRKWNTTGWSWIFLYYKKKSGTSKDNHEYFCITKKSGISMVDQNVWIIKIIFVLRQKRINHQNVHEYFCVTKKSGTSTDNYNYFCTIKKWNIIK